MDGEEYCFQVNTNQAMTLIKENCIKKRLIIITVLFKEEGLYTVDFQCPSGKRVEMFSLFSLGKRQFILMAKTCILAFPL